MNITNYKQIEAFIRSALPVLIKYRNKFDYKCPCYDGADGDKCICSDEAEACWLVAEAKKILSGEPK